MRGPGQSSCALSSFTVSLMVERLSVSALLPFEEEVCMLCTRTCTYVFVKHTGTMYVHVR